MSKTYHFHFGHTYKMAKKKSPPKPTRMFPSLHPDVSDAVSEHITPPAFNDTNTNKGTRKTYKTHVTGGFRCYNNNCSQRAWTSGKIAILIRQYTNGSYNAEVCGQRCRSCERLGKLNLDNECYVERVSYRLLAWSGVQQERPEYRLKGTPPHEESLCEGCKRGICGEAGR